MVCSFISKLSGSSEHSSKWQPRSYRKRGVGSRKQYHVDTERADHNDNGDSIRWELFINTNHGLSCNSNRNKQPGGISA